MQTTMDGFYGHPPKISELSCRIQNGVAETVLADASVHFEFLQVRRKGEPENQPGEFVWSNGTAKFVGKRKFIRPP